MAVGQVVLAQQPPSAGSQLQQIPPPPVPQRAAPGLGIEPERAPELPAAGAESRILVTALEVTGATVFDEATLLAATGFQAGQQLTLSDLRALAAKI
ncbi:MAG: peptide transporter, partial [Ramlibacter sp.]|nr:peptide transporter [Ramlibacter sp.]